MIVYCPHCNVEVNVIADPFAEIEAAECPACGATLESETTTLELLRAEEEFWERWSNQHQEEGL